MRSMVMFAAVVLSACASRPFIVNTAVPLSFSHVEIQSESLTAKDGELIFQGTSRASETAILLDRVDQEVPVRSNALHKLKSGAELYRIKTKGNSASTYCSTEESFSGQAPIGLLKGQSCLMDEDGDKIFESVWVGPFTTSPMISGNLPASKIGLAMIQDQTPLNRPVSYKLADNLAIEGETYGIAFSDLGGGDAMLQKILITRGRHYPYSRVANANDSVEFSNSELPQSVDFIGLRIEIMELEEGELTYKIDGPAKADNSFVAYQSFPCASNPDEMCEKDPFD